MDDHLKDIKQISVLIPTHLNDLKPDIELLIDKKEQIIKTYLERHIYTSSMSDNDKEKLELLFAKHRKTILDTF